MANSKDLPDWQDINLEDEDEIFSKTKKENF